jgi:hypothetical protein
MQGPQFNVPSLCSTGAAGVGDCRTLLVPVGLDSVDSWFDFVHASFLSSQSIQTANA